MSSLHDVVYGAAIGDALGVPFEFKQRDTFECAGMVGNGTTACVAGALAGAYYGYGAISKEWLETLRGKDIIESCLF